MEPPDPNASTTFPAGAEAIGIGRTGAIKALEMLLEAGSAEERESGASEGNSNVWSAPTVEEVSRWLAPKFRILALLGKGGMAAVYLGFHNTMGRQVAIKILPPDLAARFPFLITRFREEMQTIGSTKYDHIVTAHDADTTDGGIHFLVMEYIEGKDLADVLKTNQGRIDPSLAAMFTCHICKALEALHTHPKSRTVHLDITPKNILIEEKSGMAKLADFGLARFLYASGGDLSRPATQIMGTIPYMAREALAGEPPQSCMDIFSLGVVLGEMLTGSNVPSSWEQSTATPGSLEFQLRAAAQKASHPDKNERFKSAAEFRHHIEAIVSGVEKEVEAQPSGAVAPGVEHLLSTNGRSICDDLLARGMMKNVQRFDLSVRSNNQRGDEPFSRNLVLDLVYRAAGTPPMVILGRPGSGKSMALALAYDWLLREKTARPAAKIPVYLSLASMVPMAYGPQTMSLYCDWVVRLICQTYGIAPRHRSDLSDLLVAQRSLILLFDGLNEAPRAAQAQIGAALAAFGRQGVSILATCRNEDFALFREAIPQTQTLELQPVADAVTVFRRAGMNDLARSAADTGSEFHSLVSSPLFLQIILGVIADRSSYHSREQVEKLVQNWLRDKSMAEHMLITFAAQQRLEKHSAVGKLAIQDCCAQIVHEANRRPVGSSSPANPWFFVEKLSPADWLWTPAQRAVYLLILGLMHGVLLAAITGLVTLVAQVVSEAAEAGEGRLLSVFTIQWFWQWTRPALVCLVGVSGAFVLLRDRRLLGAALGLAFAATRAAALSSSRTLAQGKSWQDFFMEMAPVSAIAGFVIFAWLLRFDALVIDLAPQPIMPTWRGARVLGLGSIVVILASAGYFWYCADPAGGVAISLTLWGCLWWAFVHADVNALITAEWNQGVKNSLARSLRMALMVTAFACGLHFAVWLVAKGRGEALINMALALGAMASVLAFGTTAVLQHYALRLCLWLRGELPLRLSAVLKSATEASVLNRVGGGYQFFHPLAASHFASLRQDSAAGRQGQELGYTMKS